MNRFLTVFNLAGILLVFGISIVQWNVNRRLNLHSQALEATRRKQEARLNDQDKALKGCAADLDLFRDQLSRASEVAAGEESKRKAAEREAAQAAGERDQLQASVSKWAQAVEARDEQLRQANEALERLGSDRNDLVTKFNDLAEKYNETVKLLNERTQRLNELLKK